MEIPEASRLEGDEPSTAQREGHWLPSLRPDTHGPSTTSIETIPFSLTQTAAILVSPSVAEDSIQEHDREQSREDTKGEMSDDHDREGFDPALATRQSDTTRILNSVVRTTSFPDLTETPREAILRRDDTLSHQYLGSQQARVDEVEMFTEESGTAMNAEAELISAYEPPVQGNISHSAPENEAHADTRYEEGVPLISTEIETSLGASTTVIEQDHEPTPATELGGDDAAWFSQLQPEHVVSKRIPMVDRKSTSEVLQSLDMENKEGSDSPKMKNAHNDEEFFSQLGTNDQPTENNNDDNEDASAKWAAAFGDDDEDFLIDDGDDLLPDSEPDSPSSFIAQLDDSNSMSQVAFVHENSTKKTQQQSLSGTASNPYSSQPSIGAQTHMLPQPMSNADLSRAGLPLAGSYQNQLRQSPTMVSRAESFADQSKGGYKSPYDLPLDLSKPKRRSQAPRPPSQGQKNMAPPPPPRSSSISSDKQLQSPFTPTSQTTPASSTHSPPMSQRSQGVPSRPTDSSRPTSSSSFFEELPVNARAKPTSVGRVPSMHAFGAAPIHGFPKQQPGSSQSRPPPPSHIDSTANFELRPPEKLDPYANVALQAPLSIPPPSSKYSPAPPGLSSANRSVSAPRYSPAPASQPAPANNRYTSQPAAGQVPPPSSLNRQMSQPVHTPTSSVSLPHLPRTSSPLAHPRPTTGGSLGTDSQTSPPTRQAPAQTAQSGDQHQYNLGRSPEMRTRPDFMPPARSQTQSPGRQKMKPAFAAPPIPMLPRPTSAFSNSTPVKSTGSLVESGPTMAPLGAPSRRTTTEIFDYVKPTDQLQFDPLERWKGAPVFRFGFGGNVVSSIPILTPRYTSGNARPQMKPTCGPVSVRTAKDLAVSTQRAATFPGPLRAKSKKKDLVGWMNASLIELEAEAPAFTGAAEVLPDPRKRHEEKILLWKIVRIMVEHDAALETNGAALSSINAILSPEMHAIGDSTTSQYGKADDQAGIYRPTGASTRTETIEPTTIEALRKHLLKGKREDAVWHAVDNRLWSHALLISSTLERKVWKQVVQEFVRQEIKTIGVNTESLSAIYEIFGGNVEESIDQLVPPSARAGMQMVSRVENVGPIKNAIDGLDRWRETVTLILNNRSVEDQKALLTLARLLEDYGRIEASHICLLFARSAFPGLFGGMDELQTSITLLGSDRRAQPGEIQLDPDSMMLTEVYEFATCILGGSSTAIPMPYLAVYKLQRAKELTDLGLKSEAQAYCDAIAAGLKSSSKTSPYYHPVLFAELDELSNRIKQIPVQSSSWMAKPSIEKVSGSIFSKFTNFVAGDDVDAQSNASGKEPGVDVGPFANISGSPSLSPSNSQTDLYGSYPVAGSTVPHTAAGNRYAPNGLPSTTASSEIARGRPSIDSQRSPPSSSYGYQFSPLANQGTSPARSAGAYQPLGTSPSQLLGTSPSFNGFQSTPPQSSYGTNSYQPSQIVQQHISEESVPVRDAAEQVPFAPVVNQASQPEQPSYGLFAPPNQSAEHPTEQANQEMAYEEPQSYGYAPPEDSGYVPYQPEPESDDDKPKPKKKSFMDDDDDDYPRASYNKDSTPAGSASRSAGADEKSQRKANDEAAGAAFRAAAEADAKRAEENAAAKKAAGGWLGGWFGGKKKTESLDASTSSGGGPGASTVYKAKLGEKSKFYFDKELGKWVNPDDPNSMQGKSATPPPPPGMGRSSVPPPSLPSRTGTPASTSSMPPMSTTPALPPSTSVPPALFNGSGASTSMPPTTTTTPLPPALGSTIPSKSANKTSVDVYDDLLGPPTGAKKSGARSTKKGRGRYVDVMAK